MPELERAQLGFDHVLIGAELMRQWKLPHAPIDAVSRHHLAAELLADLEDSNATGERVVAMAAAVGDYYCTRDRGAALARTELFASAFFQMDRPIVEEYLGKLGANRPRGTCSRSALRNSAHRST